VGGELLGGDEGVGEHGRRWRFQRHSRVGRLVSINRRRHC
jgi:hypothetical protein